MSGYFSPTTRNSFLYWEFFYRNLEQTWRRLQLARSLMKSPHYKKNQDLRVTNSLQNFRKPLQRWCLRWLPVTRKTREGNWFAMAFVDYYKFSDGFVICKVLRWLCHPLRFMTLSPIKNCGGFVIHKKFATNLHMQMDCGPIWHLQILRPLCLQQKFCGCFFTCKSQKSRYK